MNNSVEMITITQEEYDELLDDQLFLEALRIVGVDNWDGYDEAVNTYQDMLKSDDYLNE